MIFNSILHLLCEAAVASRNSKRSWRAHLFHDSHGLGNVKESEIKPRVTGHGGHELTHERHGSRLVHTAKEWRCTWRTLPPPWIRCRYVRSSGRAWGQCVPRKRGSRMRITSVLRSRSKVLCSFR